MSQVKTSIVVHNKKMYHVGEIDLSYISYMWSFSALYTSTHAPLTPRVILTL